MCWPCSTSSFCGVVHKKGAAEGTVGRGNRQQSAPTCALAVSMHLHHAWGQRPAALLVTRPLLLAHAGTHQPSRMLTWSQIHLTTARAMWQ